MPPRASILRPVAETMMSASSSVAGCQADAAFGQGLDLAGHDRRTAGADGAEHVGIGYDAQALVPRLVAPARNACRPHNLPAGSFFAARRISRLAVSGMRTTDLVQTEGDESVLPADNVMGGLRQATLDAAQLAMKIARRQRHQVRRRTLQHSHVRGAFRHRGNQSDGGCAATDHHDVAGRCSPGPVRPKLRVHQPSAETGSAGKIGIGGQRRSCSSRCIRTENRKCIRRSRRRGQFRPTRRPARVLRRP